MRYLKYIYKKHPYLYQTCDDVCSKCSYSYQMLNKYYDDELYKVNNLLYCGLCIELLEDSDPDWSLGVHSSS